MRRSGLYFLAGVGVAMAAVVLIAAGGKKVSKNRSDLGKQSTSKDKTDVSEANDTRYEIYDRFRLVGRV